MKKSAEFAELKKLCAEICDLKSSIALLDWDQQVNMPPAAGDARAAQTALLSRKEHELLTSERFGALLDALEDSSDELEPESDEFCLLRALRRDWHRERLVPPEYVEEFAMLTGLAFGSWVRAKDEDDFTLFRDDLRRIFDLRRQYAAFFGAFEHVYDPLLDDFEPGMKTAEVQQIFAVLRPAQVELVRAIGEKPQIDDAFLRGNFPAEAQWELSRRAAKTVGFDFTRGRLDRAEHPFTTTFSRNDVRITTHIYPDNMISALYSTIHESGHALYEQSIASSLDRTTLDTGASLLIHESQSRLWENVIGRSVDFITGFYPELERIFPQLRGVSSAQFYRAVNKVEPSLIRTEADEATYNLHIMLRMELEIAVLQGDIGVNDLPGAWREKMRQYLGVAPANDRDGVLQDVHWATGAIGYFPTYALGNIFSAQVREAAGAALPDLPQQLRRQELEPLRAFLTANIYRHGAKFTSGELVRMLTGKTLDTAPYLRYLTGKFGALYQIY